MKELSITAGIIVALSTGFLGSLLAGILVAWRSNRIFNTSLNELRTSIREDFFPLLDGISNSISSIKNIADSISTAVIRISKDINRLIGVLKK
jgi:hypothetical protein